MTRMETFPTASATQVIERLNKALARLQERDAALLDATASERSIACRLACHLQPLFPDWDVDCEFNCWAAPGQQKGHLVVGTTSAATEACTIFPDLLIHRREHGERLAVLELHTSSHGRARHLARKKLKLCQERLNCQLALLLELGVDESRGEHQLEVLDRP
ncbi:hypothetical protein [Halomonas urumqiensis]|uniref:Uncharacterized protein n=1 Tax=Halomonas urumqiensis TaxID=1684789 RepID=A0A2N7UNW7_9GAMM|nr:hypothetical protein [Halomonas urumqiensis]PMR82092.1 hypothetical protein C1H70_02500 [Halomonas urumqiensis]PTB02577.1 hypothetical protein C6V82_07965 [Halomonas urumqiensis]GHE21057.1 hypothetical protein GCM10017767_15780 [Halomonas urumqiensis]